MLSVQFLNSVAKGREEEAERILINNPGKKLLLETGTFTDNSGRTFTCSAFEYAFWAKDIYMCRTLAKYMDEETRVEILKRCVAIKNSGLTYYQDDIEVNNSRCFDFTPLKRAYKKYMKSYDPNTCEGGNRKFWLNIGEAQLDFPAHVVHELCRQGSKYFNPKYAFNEATLPRHEKYKVPGDGGFWDEDVIDKYEDWFGSFVNPKNLEAKFTIIRCSNRPYAEKNYYGGDIRDVENNLKTITSLDEVRTAELDEMLEKHLKQIKSSEKTTTKQIDLESTVKQTNTFFNNKLEKKGTNSGVQTVGAQMKIE